jgi:hypothetical protein
MAERGEGYLYDGREMKVESFHLRYLLCKSCGDQKRLWWMKDKFAKIQG